MCGCQIGVSFGFAPNGAKNDGGCVGSINISPHWGEGNPFLVIVNRGEIIFPPSSRYILFVFSRNQVMTNSPVAPYQPQDRAALILVVERNPMVQRLERFFLEQAGYSV